ncbi:MAG: hypothetical protein ACLT9P_06015 [Evtepia gabavorous]
MKLLMANGAARAGGSSGRAEAGLSGRLLALSWENRSRSRWWFCDSQTLSVQQALRDRRCWRDAQVRRERIAVVPGGAEESVSQLVARAKELNSERVVLVAPGISEEAGGALVAAAVAGAICRRERPRPSPGRRGAAGDSGPGGSAMGRRETRHAAPGV